VCEVYIVSKSSSRIEVDAQGRFLYVCVKGKVFEQRYCTAIVTECKMRFSLRLNFVLLTALLEDDGRGTIMTSPSIFIHRAAARAATTAPPTSSSKLSFGCRLYRRIASKPQRKFLLSLLSFSFSLFVFSLLVVRASCHRPSISLQSSSHARPTSASNR